MTSSHGTHLNGFNFRVCEEVVFYFGRIDIFTSAYDHIFYTTDNVTVAILINDSDVSATK